MRILSSASARPNFVKLAAVHHALKKHPGIEHLIVHTGQHYDPMLSDIFFEQLSIPAPVKNLGVRGGATNEETIAMTEQAMGPVLQELKPDVVLVYGDVNGAVGSARAAKSLGIRLGHIEAGLRSGDMDMPEEHNRIEIDGIADELFVSELSGLDHLATEKIQGKVHFVGNTMIDTLLRMLPAIGSAEVPFNLPSEFGVATLHRPSNVDNKEALQANLVFLADIAEHCPLILPLHARTKASVERFGLSFGENVHIVDPLGYIEFLALIRLSLFILTDSGGIQEEATLLRKKCFTLRLNTERPSTVSSGSNELIDLSKESDRKKVLDFAADPEAIDVKIPEKWDGKAGERIVEVLLG